MYCVAEIAEASVTEAQGRVGNHVTTTGCDDKMCVS